MRPLFQWVFRTEVRRTGMRSLESQQEVNGAPVERERRWLAHYPACVPQTLKYPAIPAFGLFDTAPPNFPTATPAFTSVTSSRIASCARWPAARASADAVRVRPGDRVGVLMPNMPEFLAAQRHLDGRCHAGGDQPLVRFGRESLHSCRRPAAASCLPSTCWHLAHLAGQRPAGNHHSDDAPAPAVGLEEVRLSRGSAAAIPL